MALYSLALSIAPLVRDPAGQGTLSWSHWLGFVAWLILFNLVNVYSARRLPERDPYLLPIASLLSGWGLLMIFRLYPEFGLRQTAWLAVAGGLLIAGMRLPPDLGFLRRYKYLWLTGGLLLAGLTLFFGTNPQGFGQRLWLGCCGIYLQPSEPLKLLLIAYLAAYLADRMVMPALEPKSRTASPLLPLLAPTLIMTGMALMLLLAQRDLGAAFIFIFLYATILYLASGRRRIIGISLLVMIAAGVAGYFLFDVVQARIDTWLNPWLDPSGRSYQIVQSLLAIANGGLMGRGPGLGNPGLVPVPHSDFIFASIAEESGLVGVLGLILLVGLLAVRGMRIALNAPDAFRRYLAAGLTVYLAAQSILIIGGNLRLLPLTGVTLPFVSYGGSSLVTSTFSLLLLLLISRDRSARPAALPSSRPYLQVGGLLLAGLAATALAAGWWAIYRSPELLTRTDNPRRAISDRLVQRGAILDREGNPINATTGTAGDYTRQSLYPTLSNIVGYTDPLYGQTGLEASLDPWLRGLQGNPASLVAWNQLVYGRPPKGVDVRTSLDFDLQRAADQLLGEHKGAVVVLNPQSGEILAMASHPGFDANNLGENWDALIQDADSPLVNRATQALYPVGPALGPLLLAKAESLGRLPETPQTAETSGEVSLDGLTMDCALPPGKPTWSEAVANGCPGVVAELGRTIGKEGILRLYQTLGFFTAPQAYLPADSSTPSNEALDATQLALGKDLRLSPLQMALAAASLSSGGLRPAPYLVTGVNTLEDGWVALPAVDKPSQALTAEAAIAAANQLADADLPIWQSIAVAPAEEGTTTWYLGGTMAGWGGEPLVVVVALTDEGPSDALDIGRGLLQHVMKQQSP